MGLGVTALASLLPQNSDAQSPRASLVPNTSSFCSWRGCQPDRPVRLQAGTEKQFKRAAAGQYQHGTACHGDDKGSRRSWSRRRCSSFTVREKTASGCASCCRILSKVADDLCIINSMHTNAINHDPAKTFICTGSEIPGKASMGAWLSYGLGSMNRDLPDFIVLTSAYWTGGTRNVQALYSRLWGSGFLPSQHQGVAFQTSGDPVLFLSNPRGIDTNVRRRMLDTLGQVNEKHFTEIGDPEIETTIAQQEMAFRMQASVPELTDISQEPPQIMDLYGPEVHKNGSFARNCLLARRMVERGVRFIQIFHRGWDHHTILPKQLPGQCFDVDQPSAALLSDLKQRGLLDDTIGSFCRRIWSHGLLPRQPGTQRLRPRPSSPLFLGMAGGRRNSGRDHLRPDR